MVGQCEQQKSGASHTVNLSIAEGQRCRVVGICELRFCLQAVNPLRWKTEILSTVFFFLSQILNHNKGYYTECLQNIT